MTYLSRQFAALVTAILLVPVPAALATEEAQPQVTVTGEGEVSVAPDMAILQLTVSREADTAREALDANSQAMADVLVAMREDGVAERDLQTSSFTIQPRYVYPQPRNEQPPRIVGYTVRNSLTVRVRDLSSLGTLLDQSVTLGVNQGGNVQFTNENPAAVLAQARAAAVKDAMARARTMAEAAGVELGKVLEISEQSHVPDPGPYRAERSMAMSASDAVPVAAGENSYRVLVNMRLAIDQ